MLRGRSAIRPMQRESWWRLNAHAPPRRSTETLSHLAAVFFQPRHDLDEVAGSVAVIELPLENAVPGVPAAARRPRQAKNVGALGDAAAGARLDRRRRDLLICDHEEDGREAVDFLF